MSAAPPLPPPPTPEPPADCDLLKLAPVFYERVMDAMHDMERLGFDPVIVEGFRSDERQDWLYKCGREFDDGRGIVTAAPTARKSWHRYGLAVDIVSKSNGWDAPPAFFRALRVAVAEHGLTSGDDWNRNDIPVEDDPDEHFADKPHVQHYCPGMHVIPSDHAWELLQTRGIEGVWREVEATKETEPAR